MDFESENGLTRGVSSVVGLKREAKYVEQIQVVQVKENAQAYECT
jgi:hypothetical protein